MATHPAATIDPLCSALAKFTATEIGKRGGLLRGGMRRSHWGVLRNAR